MITRRFDTMSALLLSVIGLSMGLHYCPMWKDLAPCTCRMDSSQLKVIICEKMGSYEQVVNLLGGHFTPGDRVSLTVHYSKLVDLPRRTFKELNMSIENLKLNHDSLRYLHPESFDGLTSVMYLSLADNDMDQVPEQLWRKMPNLKTLDLGRTKIGHLYESSFRELRLLQTLVLPGNLIIRVEQNSIPSQLRQLHLGRNFIFDLNGTLVNMPELSWLFINANHLTSLENQLPEIAPNLSIIHASDNRLTRLPQRLRSYTNLETLFVQDNQVIQLDGILSKSRQLKRLVLDKNEISMLREDEFEECVKLESLILSQNQVRDLNGSLLNLVGVNFINITNNLLEEFSFQEIIGLQRLRSIDLSFNRIKRVIGPAALPAYQNLVEWNIRLTEIRLNNNHLEALNGALSGLPELLRLDLSFNKLTHISPEDLIGLDQLRLLDISYNRITTLEETSQTFLPRLEELRASHNYLTIMERDFHGLPVLCYADLSSNHIIALGRDLVSKTRCKVGHGVHEGAWDTLKIDLGDNPILCDAALPEIASSMEVNHTRITGVSHCPPLREQPVTSKPNSFLGYIPEVTSSVPSAISTEVGEAANADESPENQVPVNLPYYTNPGYQPIPYNIRRPSSPLLNDQQVIEDSSNKNSAKTNEAGVSYVDQQYIINDTQEFLQRSATNAADTNTSNQAINDDPSKLQQDEINLLEVKNPQNASEVLEFKTQAVQNEPAIDRFVMKDEAKPVNGDEEHMQSDQPVRPTFDANQERQLSKMASEIQELRSQLQELANQNDLLAKNLNEIRTISNQSKEQDKQLEYLASSKTTTDVLRSR